MSRRTTNGHRPARVHIYPHYQFIDKDPSIDRIRTMVEDEGIRSSHAALISGLSPTTLSNWFDGDTRRPQFASIMAITRALGYDLEFKKRTQGKIDVEAELEAAARALAEREKHPTRVPRIKPFHFA